MDKIRILNLKIPATHGVYEFEKQKEGLFELDIEMHLSLKKPAKSDDLIDTVNYDEAVNIITRLFTEKDYNLIESVGEKICTCLLKKYPIKKVKLKIRKPHAPIKATLDTVEVELIRRADH
ncbi:MAG: dihydroneopterin aldolase [Fidelibacterota bacterium]|jgi:dihydroneopterin aldolase